MLQKWKPWESSSHRIFVSSWQRPEQLCQCYWAVQASHSRDSFADVRYYIKHKRACGYYPMLWLPFLSGLELMGIQAACLLSVKMSQKYLKIQMENENMLKLWISMYRRARSTIPESSLQGSPWWEMGLFPTIARVLPAWLMLWFWCSKVALQHQGSVASCSGSSGSCRIDLPLVFLPGVLGSRMGFL